MTVDTVIAGGRLVTPTGVSEGSVAIDGETIVAVGREASLPEADRRIDAAGRLVMPGVVDPHVHIDEVPENRAGTMPAETAAAALGGMLLGLDRELRGRATGLRTHGMVSLSSCVITISAFLVYEEALAAGDRVAVDPLRAIQGLAQAIGFIAAGAIFVSKGDVRNLTSAANLWLAAAFGIARQPLGPAIVHVASCLAAAFGIALGAGQYTLAGVSVVFGIVMMSVVRLIEFKLHMKDPRDAD